MKNALIVILILGTISSYSQSIKYSEIFEAVFDGESFIEKLLDGDFVLVSKEKYEHGLSGSSITTLAYQEGYNAKNETANFYVGVLGKTIFLNYKIHIMVTETHKYIFDNLKSSIIQNCEKTDFYFSEEPVYGDKGMFITVYRKEYRYRLSHGVQFNIYKEIDSNNVISYCIDAESYIIK